jgi:hypothetical protein
MTMAAILNAVLMLGVVVVVVAPLGWAILTQHRDEARAAIAEAVLVRADQSRERPRVRRPQYGRAAWNA